MALSDRLAPLPPEERRRRLTRAKRIAAPLRALVITGIAALSAGQRSLEWGAPVSIGLVLVYLNAALERATTPAMIERWQEDRRSKAGLVLSFTLVVIASFAEAGRWPLLDLPAQAARGLLIAGGALLVLGSAIRQWAIHTLGTCFTDRARIVEGHRLITSGPYAVVRHPAYSGLALVFLGVPLLLGSVVGLALSVLLLPVALRFRVRVEERQLAEHFGAAWKSYARCTPRFVPWPRG
ncbi:MAG: isoprenylcysteine carboxylmethyltransferase family protein [Deltaproteobacteria bacterium]|nr:isoprenylcysteine carboxylmethyltransferase family protein [Deltaproteobacteria bacterium]